MNGNNVKSIRDGLVQYRDSVILHCLEILKPHVEDDIYEYVDKYLSLDMNKLIEEYQIEGKDEIFVLGPDGSCEKLLKLIKPI